MSVFRFWEEEKSHLLIAPIWFEAKESHKAGNLLCSNLSTSEFAFVQNWSREDLLKFLWRLALAL